MEENDYSSFDVEEKKRYAKNLMKKFNKEKKINILDEAMNLDNTLPNIYYEKLKIIKDDYKLKERSFDILDKKQLKEFNINKTDNYKEIYFYIIHYLEGINLDEPEKAEKGYETEEFVKKQEKQDLQDPKEEEPDEGGEEEEDDDDGEEEEKEFESIEEKYVKGEVKINNEEVHDKIAQEAEKISPKSISDEEKMDNSEFKKYLDEKEKFDIRKILILKETINIEKISNKFNQIYDKIYKFLNFRNNYPELESENFFYNCIRYTLETFQTLKYKKFIKKILIIKKLKTISILIENNKISDKLIKMFYYYIINAQYDLDYYLLGSFTDYGNDITNFNLNSNYKIKNNALYKDEKKLIENIDNYSITKMSYVLKDFKINDAIEKITDTKEEFYNIKGKLNNLPFKKEDGDKYWKEFLLSPVLEELQSKLFRCNENIFNKENIIKFFQKNSFYFPNFNDNFTALSHKEIFKMFFSIRKFNFNIKELCETKVEQMILRAFIKVDIQHEWGHTASSLLFFDSKIQFFDTPERNIKFFKNKKMEISKEGGEIVEYLLYGKIINKLNAKQAIYILDSQNYQKNLNQFRADFKNNLKNKSLIKVFKDALKNPNIEECVKNVLNEYRQKGRSFKNNLNYYEFKAKNKKSFNKIDYEKLIFESNRNHHH